MDILLSSASAS